MKREESYEVNALPEPGVRLLREEGGRPWGKRAGRCCLALRSGAGPGAQSQRVPLTGHCDFSTLSWVPGHSWSVFPEDPEEVRPRAVNP